MSAAIEVEGLVKVFGDTRAVDGVSMHIPAGSVMGMLGANGAGKTTIVRILATLVPPDGGHARVAGYDVVTQAHEVRRRVGLTGQYASVDENIPGWDNLYMIARLYELPRARARAVSDDLLERFGLTSSARKLARDYSGGMRRRLDLAASLVGRPQVLFLDEPTTGLDPRSRIELWDMVRDLAHSGTTVLLTTQYMEEAEALAETVVVIDHGRVIASGTSADLRSRIGGQVLRVRSSSPAGLDEVARLLGGTTTQPVTIDPQAGLLTLPLHSSHDVTTAVRVLAASGITLDGIDTHVPSLDEVFLALTAHSKAGPPGLGEHP